MAKEFYNQLSGTQGLADCCGTRVGTCEGQAICDVPKDGVENDIRAMQAVGLDISNNRRKQLTPELLRDADQVVVMAEPETWPDYLRNHPNVIVWEVENPKDATYETICAIRDVIKTKVERLVAC